MDKLLAYLIGLVLGAALVADVSSNEINHLYDYEWDCTDRNADMCIQYSRRPE